MSSHNTSRYVLIAGMLCLNTGLSIVSVAAQQAKPPDGGTAGSADANKTAAPQTDKAIATMQKQAAALVQQKHYKEARDLYLQVLGRQEFLSGKTSKELIGPLNDIVKTSCMAGACYDAMPKLKRLLEIKRATYGNNYADLPFNLQLMGEACEKKGKYAEALNYFNQAVEAQKRIGGSKNNIDMMLAINTGRALEHLNQKPAAKKLYLNLLSQAKQRNLPEDDTVYKAINARMAKLKGSTK
ncbi:MAG: tetratricopeptide repeat protein [Candidatus Obscuribacter sp.]|nr:tetratricopeptide repeat protein [Candidatus Obscuribacter sp.]